MPPAPVFGIWAGVRDADAVLPVVDADAVLAAVDAPAVTVMVACM